MATVSFSGKIPMVVKNIPEIKFFRISAIQHDTMTATFETTTFWNLRTL
jgi:hypothetical protein